VVYFESVVNCWTSTPSSNSVLVRVVGESPTQITQSGTPFEGVGILIVKVIIVMNLVTVLPVSMYLIKKDKATLKSVPVDVKPDLRRQSQQWR
jgi:hypothetical protein